MQVTQLRLMAALGLMVGLWGCGGQSLTLSGTGEVAIVVQTKGASIDDEFIRKARDIMVSACASRGWVLFEKPVPMRLPTPGNKEGTLIIGARAKDDLSAIAETVERVFRWFPSQAVTLSGCCVAQEDKSNAKKACPAAKEKPSRSQSSKATSAPAR